MICMVAVLCEVESEVVGVRWWYGDVELFVL